MKGFRIKTFFLIIIFVSFLCGSAQIKKDTLNTDSLPTVAAADTLPHIDSIKPNKIEVITIDSLLKKNKYLNLSSPPVSFIIKEKTTSGKELLFYVLGTFILMLAVFKAFYSKYFNNILKVFFNTSLRQNQLTEILLQAKLPSLIFNFFFVITAGLYVWLLLVHYHLLKNDNDYIFILFSILAFAVIYFGKFISLKFMGWITGMSASADQYIFIIFLINKITCIVLIPFIILLAFTPAVWLNTIIIFSWLVLGFLFLLRWLRTFSLLQHQLNINRFHFLLYIIAIEILPIMILYKLVLKILSAY